MRHPNFTKNFAYIFSAAQQSCKEGIIILIVWRRKLSPERVADLQGPTLIVRDGAIQASSFLVQSKHEQTIPRPYHPLGTWRRPLGSPPGVSSVPRCPCPPRLNSGWYRPFFYRETGSAGLLVARGTAFSEAGEL